MGTIEDFKAQQMAMRMIKTHQSNNIEICKNNINNFAQILESRGISPFDCSKEMARKLKGTVSTKELKRLLEVNDQLILWTKVLNILKKHQTV